MVQLRRVRNIRLMGIFYFLFLSDFLYFSWLFLCMQFILRKIYIEPISPNNLLQLNTWQMRAFLKVIHTTFACQQESMYFKHSRNKKLLRQTPLRWKNINYFLLKCRLWLWPRFFSYRWIRDYIKVYTSPHAWPQWPPPDAGHSC